MVCFAIITPFKSKQYHTDIFSIAQNVGIVNALPTKLRQCFFYGSFKGEPADHFVDIFLSDEAAVNDVLLPVDLIFRNTLRKSLYFSFSSNIFPAFSLSTAVSFLFIANFTPLASLSLCFRTEL